MGVSILTLISSNLGYPRIGERREWKRALESFWNGNISESSLEETLKDIRLLNLKKQKEKGIDLIPVGDFSLYDHVLDTAFMFGYIPSRFQHMEPTSLKTYFAMARGSDEAEAMEMTKWFNTNYHYIVPELENKTPALVKNRLLELFQEAKNELNIEAKPVLLGPITFLKLAKQYDQHDFHKHLSALIPVYVQLLTELAQAGAKWVQIDEPILVQELDDSSIPLFKEVYDAFHKALPSLNIILQTYFESITHYQEIVSLPVAAIGLDFVHDHGVNLSNIKTLGFPKDKILAAGLIDGRNIWKASLVSKAKEIDDLAQYVDIDRLIIQPSCSLLHVPVTVQNEQSLPSILKNALSFADEKLDEVNELAQYAKGKRTIDDLKQYDRSYTDFIHSSFRTNEKVQEASKNIGAYPTKRLDYTERQKLHKKRWNLPILPTTTIGSFPQTKEIRQIRLKWRKGEYTNEQYESVINNEIKKWIDIQEQLGLDVFVHGEFERTDMVEFFGEKLNGIAVTNNGWVQSYGSRCVRPPIIYGDVAFDQPMTVKESVYAQSLTSKPVKGMLTGPVTILNWSFVRNDIDRISVLRQLALAIREEVLALEKNGIGMIQVDEPALREGLPLKQSKQKEYIEGAAEAFKLATSSVRPETQIHTHMCYSQFEDIMEAIDDLDADVISIESSRSHGELVHAFETYQYKREIGLGVYDIHSPRIPSVEEMAKNIDRALAVLDVRQFWVNPDCGLKTRSVDETISALKVMVEAAKTYREKITAAQI
ncbi:MULTISPECIES: 5-methyltetrahydropteroyltriglutamate--homocysteine S-methyltransferase [Aeribacillus]|jgi:5-methyltetrahydropteroyltriglutamate--homocysteine S-methyltransferase|uniref:5-methyltetrahydropteroyltriglutamate--homocysteine methyltransferase n=1 Tax=Aeribacillus pallidus TaxID=33936 RepID=A0A223E2T8_9BACI|nr:MULTISPECIES: 5-methyltetrahydropteroyltriglutamate--homocysteine S-methyltransferase [Aeribacillus]ASS89574.1 5-methyltetrahydropteroyltriglutamate--homocysteine S-methyltransferase [Aeribacillus pallidus]MED0702685.1 5-methyltetrahydropteroyltriglutamate--homocysteine S-methyltransferase [Aeribacillus composti]